MSAEAPGDFGQAITAAESEPAAPPERLEASPDSQSDGGSVDLAAIGHPRNASEYNLSGIEMHETLPWNNEFQSRMVGVMHGLGLDNTQVAGLIQEYIADQGGQFESMTSDGERSRETGLKDLRSEWGTGFDARVGLAKQALKSGAGRNLEDVANIKLADGGVLGDHPAVIKVFAELGRRMGQKGQIDTGSRESFSTMSPRDAASKKLLLMEDPKFVAAWTNEGNPRHAEAVRQINDLTEAEVGLE